MSWSNKLTWKTVLHKKQFPQEGIIYEYKKVINKNDFESITMESSMNLSAVRLMSLRQKIEADTIECSCCCPLQFANRLSDVTKIDIKSSTSLTENAFIGRKGHRDFWKTEVAAGHQPLCPD